MLCFCMVYHLHRLHEYVFKKLRFHFDVNFCNINKIIIKDFLNSVIVAFNGIILEKCNTSTTLQLDSYRIKLLPLRICLKFICLMNMD